MLIALVMTAVMLMTLLITNQTEPHQSLDVMVEHARVQKKSKDLKSNQLLRVHVVMESAMNHVLLNYRTNQIDNRIHQHHLSIASSLVHVETLKMQPWKHLLKMTILRLGVLVKVVMLLVSNAM